MTAPLAATYSDLKFIRTRKVCQLVLEIPIEQAGQVVSLLGAPNPAEEVWCAVARLDPKAVEAKPDSAPATKPKSRAQMAGILCNDVRFRVFLAENNVLGFHAPKGPEDAADWVRRICGVKSRSEFDADPAAAERWDALYAEYKRECM